VTYRVEFHASALAQLQGLPPLAFDALVERGTKLVGAPRPWIKMSRTSADAYSVTSACCPSMLTTIASRSGSST
jgi:hypothetical protein